MRPSGPPIVLTRREPARTREPAQAAPSPGRLPWRDPRTVRARPGPGRRLRRLHRRLPPVRRRGPRGAGRGTPRPGRLGLVTLRLGHLLPRGVPGPARPRGGPGPVPRPGAAARGVRGAVAAVRRGRADPRDHPPAARQRLAPPGRGPQPSPARGAPPPPP